MSRLCVVLVLTASITLLAVPVATLPKGGKQAMVLATAIVPEVAPLAETGETQVKGGISITLAPVPFKIERGPGCSYSFVTGLQLPFVPRGVSPATHQRVLETVYEAFTVVPNDLQLILTVRNRMNRVFRGAGAVVQFNAGGRLQGVDQSHYADFLAMLVPPQGEAQVVLTGPPVASLFSGTKGQTMGEIQSYVENAKTTLGVFLYDVVTDIDDAGNVVMRDNFEWYFSVELSLVSETVPSRSRKVWIPNSEAVKIMQPTPGGGTRLLPREAPTCIPGAIPG